MSYTYHRKAHYHETDQMGIIHHSNYIKWFEEARISLMNAMGLHYGKMEEEGILSPVLKVSCDYLSMVGFDEEVAIHVSIEDYNSVRFSVKYEVKDRLGEKIFAKGASKHCFVGRDKQPVILKKAKPYMHELFKQAVNNVNG